MAEQKYDSLVCGNCGYDGGAKHLQEKLEWERNLSQARRISDSTRQSRYWSAAFASVLCTLILVMGFVHAIPESPQKDKLSTVQSMYAACMSRTDYASSETKHLALATCNEAFKEEIAKISAPEDP